MTTSTNDRTMTPIDELRSRAISSWPTAGIVDARAFTVGDSDLVHDPTHARSNLIRGRCGIVARVVETDGPRASWANSYTTCPTCLANGARPDPATQTPSCICRVCDPK